MISLAVAVISGQGLLQASLTLQKALQRQLCVVFAELMVTNEKQVGVHNQYTTSNPLTSGEPVLAIVFVHTGEIPATQVWNAFVRSLELGLAHESPEDEDSLRQMVLNWLPISRDNYDTILKNAAALF